MRSVSELEPDSQKHSQPRPTRLVSDLLLAFARNPIEAMRSDVVMSWRTAILLQIAISVAAGITLGIANRNLSDILVGALVFPLTSLITAFVFTRFLASYFSLFHATFLDFHRLYCVVLLSTIPYFPMHVLAEFIPPLDLIGIALTSLLLMVGLVEQFGLQKKAVGSVVGTIAAVFCCLWIMAHIRTTSGDRAEQHAAILDRLESEIKNESRK